MTPDVRPVRRLLPTLLGALGVALWASETTLITYTTAIPPLQTVALAFAFAALLSPVLWLLTGDDPIEAFLLPWPVWCLMVGSLVGYHAVIYYATQQAPPGPAALLQGTTPLMIVLGSALLPGERLRWWHIVGAGLGFVGIFLLVEGGGDGGASETGSMFYLSLIGLAAALWGVYSVATRGLPHVPSSALGVFYMAGAALCLGAHATLETWVTPSPKELAAIAALGILPMGLAIYLWDLGCKYGDIQALGTFSYFEPFIGAALVALFTSGTLHSQMLWSGALVIGGAILASSSLWRAERSPPAVHPV
ncbi:MAG: DMT family transporter [Pseudomonadota bacterium]